MDRLGRELRRRWRLWRWAIGLAIVAASAGIGSATGRIGRTDWCFSPYPPARNPDGSVTAAACRAAEGTVHHTGGSGWSVAGAVIGAIGVVVLSWLVPLAVGRRLFPRPTQPAPLTPGEEVWWRDGAWRTRHRAGGELYEWEHDAGRREWRRGAEVSSWPWAYNTGQAMEPQLRLLLREQNRLLAEQNRLLAGLPQSAPVPTVLPASGPRPGSSGTQ